MFSVMRSDYLRHSLDLANHYWWERQELPPVELLRESLLLLERGDHLDEDHCALLLRAALHYGKGVLTALSHQADPDRTSVLLNDALTRSGSRWNAEDLASWLIRDPHAAELREYLETELAAANQLALPAQRKRIATFLKVLQKVKPNSTKAIRQEWIEEWHGLNDLPARSQTSPLRYVMALILLALIGYFFYQRYWPRWDRTNMVEVSALFQPVSPLSLATAIQPDSPLLVNSTQPDSPLLVALVNKGDLLTNVEYKANSANVAPDREPAQAEIRSVWIDRTEVTNAQYRACIASGNCAWPPSKDSTTRKDYLLDPRYNDFPVVNVDLAAAIQYCAFHSKRLPTAEEWETAAAFAPATNRRYHYPWGDQFAAQYTNSVESARGDTTQIGIYRPHGSSPLGFDDMAGNVAEWTMTLLTQDNLTKAVVKGGSYLDDASVLLTDSVQLIDIHVTEPWIGFRCAR